MTATLTTADHELAKAKLNLETSQIPWRELQRFFASGLAIHVSEGLDLVEAAYQIASDNKDQVEQWLNSRQVGQVSDQQALTWYQANTEVWAVVVKPWILVQE
ncbi:MAG: DUF2288 domain-containing protein [Gammaproteobacteria bacterium]|jgi:hypothetical protein|nr:DUF2288 domain-containing protein [Gammaproteobacteria bacterium]PKM35269.1 MAG: DUF2288 domain-containing protein [Gammaproteobacteria bacterium HGW-Gammaproteobacteria-10]